MATYYTAQCTVGDAVFKPLGRNSAGLAYGTYEIGTALSKNDILKFFRLPKCITVSGDLCADDLDTGTEALEIDIGHGGNATDTADPDAFLNSGVLTGDAVTAFTQGAIIYQPLWQLLASGPVPLSLNTDVQGVWTAAANAGGTGTITLHMFYLENE